VGTREVPGVLEGCSRGTPEGYYRRGTRGTQEYSRGAKGYLGVGQEYSRGTEAYSRGILEVLWRVLRANSFAFFAILPVLQRRLGGAQPGTREEHTRGTRRGIGAVVAGQWQRIVRYCGVPTRSQRGALKGDARVPKGSKGYSRRYSRRYSREFSVEVSRDASGTRTALKRLRSGVLEGVLGEVLRGSRRALS
jgi:hypothetical protein